MAEEATEAADDCDAAEQAAVSQTEATPPCTGGVEGEEGGAAEVKQEFANLEKKKPIFRL